MDSSSSTSSSDASALSGAEPGYAGVRPLPAAWALLALALCLIGADQTVRHTFRPQSDIRWRATVYAQQATAPGPEDVLVFGSCLPEQSLNLDDLASADGRFDVFQLGTASGTGLMWTTLLQNYVPQGAHVGAILVPFGAGDLSRRDVPWESHLMELATWHDLPDLIRADCSSFGCGVEIATRKASWLYRHRGVIAAGVWRRLGAATFEESTRYAEHLREWRSLRSESDDPWRYLERFLALARAKGVPVILTPLPHRAAVEGRWNPPPYELKKLQIRDKIISDYGAYLKAFPEVPGLTGADFEDDVHVNEQGRRLLTEALAKALPAWLDELDAAKPQ